MKGTAPNRIRVIEYDVPVYSGACGLSVIAAQIVLHESPTNWIEFQIEEVSLPIYFKPPLDPSYTSYNPQRLAFISGVISWVPSLPFCKVLSFHFAKKMCGPV